MRYRQSQFRGMWSTRSLWVTMDWFTISFNMRPSRNPSRVSRRVDDFLLAGDLRVGADGHPPCRPWLFGRSRTTTFVVLNDIIDKGVEYKTCKPVSFVWLKNRAWLWIDVLDVIQFTFVPFQLSIRCDQIVSITPTLIQNVEGIVKSYGYRPCNRPSKSVITRQVLMFE